MAKVAVLGTGLLGAGFVENLLSKGNSVVVWNRSADKIGPLVAKGAVAAASPAEAVSGVDRVHIVLAEDSAVDSVLDAARPGFAADALILDHSTNRPDRVAARYADLRAQGLRYLHAPVFMGPANAREGSGLMLLAGPADEAAALEPILATMTGKVWHVGERPDLAAAHKLFGNGFLIATTGLMGDLLSMGGAMGLAPNEVLALFDVFKPGNGIQFFGGRAAKKGVGPASFELNMARKDVRLMLEMAGGPQDLVVLPGVAAAMDQAIAEGHGAADFAVYAWPRGRKS